MTRTSRTTTLRIWLYFGQTAWNCCERYSSEVNDTFGNYEYLNVQSNRKTQKAPQHCICLNHIVALVIQVFNFQGCCFEVVAVHYWQADRIRASSKIRIQAAGFPSRPQFGLHLQRNQFDYFAGSYSRGGHSGSGMCDHPCLISLIVTVVGSSRSD